MDESHISFVADRMLGRLAKMLRLLGYDTLYARDVTAPQLLEIARRGERFVLTRGDAAKRFPGLANVFSVQSESPPEQLREIVRHFRLDPRAGLWTRCTLCNGLIERVEKSAVAPQLEEKVLRLYEEFFRCTGCGHIYWQGSHAQRILRNLDEVLGI